MADYDPGEITINFKGHLIQGYAEGTFVTVERNVDTFSMSVGADGNPTRVRSRNKSGIITVTLQAESPSNDVLSASAKSDEINGSGKGPMEVLNLGGTTICFTQEAWVRKPANVEYGDAATTREWTFETGNLDMFVGGVLEGA